MAHGTHYAPTGLTAAQEYRLATAPCPAATATAIETCTDAELVGFCRIGNPEAVRRLAAHEARRRLPIRQAEEAAQRVADARFRSVVRRVVERVTAPPQPAPDPAAELLARHEQQKAMAALPHSSFKVFAREVAKEMVAHAAPPKTFADGYVPDAGT